MLYRFGYERFLVDFRVPPALIRDATFTERYIDRCTRYVIDIGSTEAKSMLR